MSNYGSAQPAGQVGIRGGGDLEKGLELTSGNSNNTGLGIDEFDTAVDVPGGSAHLLTGNSLGVQSEAMLTAVSVAGASALV